jgi:lipopolysaccharide transport system permease protein
MPLMSVADIATATRAIRQHADPRRLVANLLRHRELLWQFTLREVQGRYLETRLGVLWALLNPLATLAVYTLVFSAIFRSAWSHGADDGLAGFALTLFTGMTAFGVFAECVTRAPGLVVGNPNYVKRVVFPLQILPVSVLGSAIFHSLVSFALIVAATALAAGRIPHTLVYLPLVYAPLVALTLGLAWWLAALGVFVRDAGPAVGILTHLLFFLTPVLYPIDAVPERLRFFLRLNPLAPIVEDFRRVVLWNLPPDWWWLAAVTLISLVVMVAGYTWFMVLRDAFADVI